MTTTPSAPHPGEQAMTVRFPLPDNRDWLSDDIWLSIPGYMRKSIQRAHEASTRAAAERIAELEGALDQQCDNMAFVLNKATLPDQWYSKFSNELEQARTALQRKEPKP